MSLTRREFGKLTLAGLPAAALVDRSLLAAMLQSRPNSLIDGVQIGTITYSYGSMGDQSAEATLKYVVDSDISAIELMGGPVNDWARKKGNPPASVLAAANRGRGGGRPGAPGAPGPGAPAAVPGAGANAAAAPGRGAAGPAGGGRAEIPADASWNGQPCSAFNRGRGPGGAGPGGPAAAVAPAGAPPAPTAQAAPGAPGGGRGRGPQTPEQIAAAQEERKWRMSLSMDLFKDLKKFYNDAGVSIYAVKDVRQETDEDLDYTFTVARTLGANHVTLELPTGPNASATLKRLGDWALKYKMFAAYHTHDQGSMTVFDEAFAASKGNMSNVDLGHFVAGGNKGGTPIDFITKFHDRISSVHLKDRTLPAHCSLNLAWGTGETPIKEILQTMRKNKYKFPASIELEYQIPQGSTAVLEVRKCLEYCRAALA